MESAARDESKSDAAALIAAAHRLDYLIHQRRMALAASEPPIAKAAEYARQPRGV
jgi:hypothetical protein